jgi:hypothetical protein
MNCPQQLQLSDIGDKFTKEEIWNTIHALSGTRSRWVYSTIFACHVAHHLSGPYEGI